MVSGRQHELCIFMVLHYSAASKSTLPRNRTRQQNNHGPVAEEAIDGIKAHEYDAARGDWELSHCVILTCSLVRK